MNFGKPLQSKKKLVDVTGFEPATPCLQSKLKKAMWLYRLAFTYVVCDGFRWYSAVIVPILFPRFAGAHLVGNLACYFALDDLPNLNANPWIDRRLEVLEFIDKSFSHRENGGTFNEHELLLYF